MGCDQNLWHGGGGLAHLIYWSPSHRSSVHSFPVHPARDAALSSILEEFSDGSNGTNENIPTQPMSKARHTSLLDPSAAKLCFLWIRACLLIWFQSEAPPFRERLAKRSKRGGDQSEAISDLLFRAFAQPRCHNIAHAWWERDQPGVGDEVFECGQLVVVDLSLKLSVRLSVRRGPFPRSPLGRQSNFEHLLEYRTTHSLPHRWPVLADLFTTQISHDIPRWSSIWICAVFDHYPVGACRISHMKWNNAVQPIQPIFHIPVRHPMFPQGIKCTMYSVKYYAWVSQEWYLRGGRSATRSLSPLPGSISISPSISPKFIIISSLLAGPSRPETPSRRRDLRS